MQVASGGVMIRSTEDECVTRQPASPVKSHLLFWLTIAFYSESATTDPLFPEVRFERGNTDGNPRNPSLVSTDDGIHTTTRPADIFASYENRRGTS